MINIDCNYVGGASNKQLYTDCASCEFASLADLTPS